MLNVKSLSARILSMSALSIVILIAVGVLALTSFMKASDDFSSVVNGTLPNTVILAKMRSDLREGFYYLVQTGLPTNTLEQTEKYLKKHDDSLNSFGKSIEDYVHHPKMEGEHELAQNLVDAFEKFDKAYRPHLTLLHNTDQKSKDKFLEIWNGDEVGKSRHALYAAIAALFEFQEKQAKTAAASTESTIKYTRILIIAALVIGVAVSSTTSWWLNRSIMQQMKQITDSLTNTSGSVEKVAKIIQESSQTLSTSSTEQAAAIHETTSAAVELTAMVERNSDNVKTSQEACRSNAQSATNGRSAVSDTVQAMNDIRDSNEGLTKQIESNNENLTQIVSLISDIASKTKVINDIVFQTKLLSFNASVEAARAGEHGKGFAVVAEEVGTLAQMSGGAAKEISEILENSINKVNKIIATSRDQAKELVTANVSKINEGVQAAEVCRTIFDSIETGVREITTMADQISVGSTEQAKGINEVSTAMNEMSATIEQNSTIAHEVSSSAEELNRQVEALADLVTKVNAFIHGTPELSSNSERPRTQAATSKRPVVNRSSGSRMAA